MKTALNGLFGKWTKYFVETGDPKGSLRGRGDLHKGRKLRCWTIDYNKVTEKPQPLRAYENTGIEAENIARESSS
ncbi:hypothetical protein CHM34_12585 [Paludifilum halophilum]|uniref:Uncharacterized protein n=1 Tax=Paludifilum halophilum TaxID=1642702 RepID=A0A235B4J6_9BACL|nr:hypothetical protein CHM34_12585 [Paludifilum halophilum]